MASETPYYEDARRQFDANTREHVMTVLHDDGLYRHVRFRHPGTGIWGFDMVTWPGHLAISGDVGQGWVFSRVADMFDFFRPVAEPYRINPGYWVEKLLPPMRHTALRFSAEKFEQYVRAHIAERADLSDEEKADLLVALTDQVFGIDDLGYAIGMADDSFFVGPANRPVELGLDFSETEIFEDWDHHFLLACFCIVWGVEQYRASKERETGGE